MTVLYALVAIAAVVFMARQVTRAERGLGEEDRVGVVELLGFCVVLPGFFVSLALAADGAVSFWTAAFAWVPCAVGVIELATWGRPHLLSRWLEAVAARRTLFRRGEDRTEFLQLVARGRPFRRYFAWWVAALPVAFLAVFFSASSLQA
ncbi:hypothetical protein [Citricoccus alkalitolerans]|uniref:DUF1295 domain-containing protein n=1 Tax=Citricoccus alkalitolerans TaxID=246603 RepID=A0ABV8Y286_9MICC